MKVRTGVAVCTVLFALTGSLVGSQGRRHHDAESGIDGKPRIIAPRPQRGDKIISQYIPISLNVGSVQQGHNYTATVTLAKKNTTGSPFHIDFLAQAMMSARPDSFSGSVESNSQTATTSEMASAMYYPVGPATVTATYTDPATGESDTEFVNVDVQPPGLVGKDDGPRVLKLTLVPGKEMPGGNVYHYHVDIDRNGYSGKIRLQLRAQPIAVAPVFQPDVWTSNVDPSDVAVGGDRVMRTFERDRLVTIGAFIIGNNGLPISWKVQNIVVLGAPEHK